ncbi:MAG: hypothetical protein WC365_07145 [Candidatus Babeliales bacterium]|jgi:hypothetical protein
MFFAQIVIPVLLIATVCFWAGMVWEKERHIAQMKVKPTTSGQKVYMKNGDWWVD